MGTLDSADQRRAIRHQGEIGPQLLQKTGMSEGQICKNNLLFCKQRKAGDYTGEVK